MKRLALLSALLLGVLGSAIGAEERNILQNATTQEGLQKVLLTDKAWVPYPAYTDRSAWDALTGVNKKALISKGEKLLSHDWPTVKATDYLELERTGNRQIMEKIHNVNCNALADLMMAELAEGEGRFMDQIINGSYYFCEMTSWALSAHTNSIQKPRTAVPIKDQHVVALVSCEMGAMLAWVDHFFGTQIDAISHVVAERIRNEVRERIIEPYHTRPEDFWWTGVKHYSNHTINNWTPWCNCNVLQCMLLLEEDPARLAEGIYKTMVSVDVFLNYVKSDGACEEGPAYWGHAAGKLYDYLRVLDWATGSKVSFFGEPMVKAMGEYIARSYVGNKWVVNFADASALSSAPAPVIYRYGRDVGSQEMCNMGAYMVQSLCASALGGGRDMLRRLESVVGYQELMAATPAVPTYDFTWYPETEFCYIRHGSIFLAAKGGYNNESHNHNDVGTFSLYVDNSPVLIDAGVGTYTRQTFGKERYNIWTMQSGYHNLPIINGFTEKFGREYRSRNVKVDEKKRTFSLDIAGAYPAEAGIRSWQRTIAVGDNKVSLTEQFDLVSPTAANELNFLTWGDVDTTKAGVVRITTPQGKSISLAYNAKLFTPSVEVIPQTDPRLSKVWGSEVKRLTLTAKRITAKGKYGVGLRIEN